jgi:hypothetical protein
MKVVLKEVIAYKIETVDGQSIGQFSKGEEWNGMTSFTSPGGLIVLDTPTDFADIFRFGNPQNKTLNVVKASETISRQLTPKQTVPSS